MTDAQFLAWLKSPAAMRCVLVEVGVSVSGAEITRYLSSSGYVTGPSESPANTVYSPCVVGGVTVREQLPIDGSASIGWGDIEIINNDGSRDSWLDDVWANRAITVLIGDMRWPRADFRAVFSGVVDDISSQSADRLNLVLRDKTQRLNTPLTEATLGGVTANKDRLLPLCFGECHNVTPLLVDPANLEYQVHNGAIERIIEVRDNGIPVPITEYLSTGKFRLQASPVGQVTASVQGAKPIGAYTNKIVGLVQHIATTYGATPLTSGDLDAVQLAVFDSAHPQPVGIYLDAKANLLDVCQRLAASVGAQVAFTPGGLLRLLKIDLPAVGTPTSVTASQMLEQSLAVATRPKIVAGVRLQYCPAWTTQSNLTSGIPPEHADLFGQEWLMVSAEDGAVATSHRITTAPTPVDTLLLTTADAQDEADRRIGLWGTQRAVMRYTGTPETLIPALGDAQTLTHPRFGLTGGKTGQIVGKSTDWLTLRATTEVLV